MADGSTQTAVRPVAALRNFMTRLTELSRDTGIGITGAPVLFCLELEDHALDYRCDDESCLTLGQPNSEPAVRERDIDFRVHALGAAQLP